MIRILFILLILSLFSCAKIGAPTGGDFDRIPPKMVKSTPEDNSINFTGKSIEIQFDEYIELKNTSEELLISPPLASKPKISSNLNRLKVEWEDTLKENTTYIFDFGTSIVDYNEGNPIRNFSLGFSTGSTIDTFYYSSKVVDAYTLKPIVRKNVILYKLKDNIDVKTQKPDYITRTDSSGNFLFKNIANSEYKILAHQDNNQNFLFDLPNESFGFLSENINSVNALSDTIKTDNIIYFNTISDEVKELKSKTLSSNHRLDLVFTKPLDDSLYIQFIYPEIKSLDDANLYYKLSAKRDSLSLFSLKYSFDSVRLKVGDREIKEEIELEYVKKKDENKSFAIKKPKEIHPYYAELLLELPFPLFDSNSFNIIAISNEDTINTIAKVSNDNPLNLKIDLSLTQQSEYKFIIPQGIILNSLSQTNDSLVFTIKTNSQKDYGNFLIKINDSINIDKSIILELEDSNNKLIREMIGKISDKFEFKYLEKGDYKLKIIYDENSNGKWDRGDFFQNKLPEKVIYFPKGINIIENWDIEEEWRL